MKKPGRIQTLAIASLSALALATPVAFAQSGSTESGSRQSAGQENGSGHGHRRGGRRGGDGEGRGFRGGHRGGKMFRGLNLTEDQQNRMQQVRESYKQRIAPIREQMRALRGSDRRSDSGATFNEAEATQRMIAAAPLRARMMAESHRMRQEMLAVLTPEQRTQMEQKRAERKARWGERRGNDGDRSDRGGRGNRGDRDDDSDED